MKKTRLLIAMLAMLVAASGYAQDSYVKAVKDFYRINGQVNQFTSALKELNTYLFDNTGGVDLNQMAERYVEECLMPELAEYAAPKMKEANVTEADLRGVISQLSTSAGKNFLEHQQAWTEAMKSELTTLMMQNISKIMMGDTSTPIQPKEGIDAGYIGKYKKIMSTSLVDSFMKMFDNTTQVPDGLKEGIKAWMKANLETIAMNSAYGIITDADLDFAQKLYSKDSYQKLQNIFSDLGQKTSMGGDLVTGYINWMRENGVTVLDGAGDIIKMVRGN